MLSVERRLRSVAYAPRFIHERETSAEGISAIEGRRRSAESGGCDTTPALYAELTTRLFLKVNLHPSRERRDIGVPMPPSRARKSAPAQYLTRINIPLYIREESSTTRDDEMRHIVELLRKQDGITAVRLTRAPKWRRRYRDCVSRNAYPLVCLSVASFTHGGMRARALLRR